MERTISRPPMKIYHSSVTWHINNYLIGHLGVGTPIESPEFISNWCVPITWQISVIPRPTFGGLLAAEFQLKRSATCIGPTHIIAKSKFTFMDNNGDVLTDIKQDGSYYSGVPVSFSNENLMSRSCLITENITIRCDILQTFHSYLSQSDIDIDLWALADDIRGLTMWDLFNDLDLIVGEEICSVNSTVVKARSPYLARILSQHPFPRDINFTGMCSIELLKGLILYWYSGELEKFPRIPCTSTSNVIRKLEQNELKPYVDPEIVTITTTFGFLSRSMNWVIEDIPFDQYSMSYESEDLAGQLIFYPKGLGGNEIYIELSISREVRVGFNVQRVELFFEDENGTEHRCKMSATFTPTLYLFPKFMMRDEFIAFRSKIRENIIRIRCRFSCPTGITGSNTEIVSFSESLEHPYITLANDIKRLLDSQDMSDISLKSGGRIFKVHTAILSARSGYFNRLFRNLKYETPKPNEIPVDDIEPDDLDMILKYIYYAEKIVLTLELAVKLYPVFYKYEIRRLYNFCSDFLQNNLDVENAFDIIELAHKFKDSYLKRTALQIILRNWDRLSQTEKWHGLVSGNHALASEIDRGVVQFLF